MVLKPDVQSQENIQSGDQKTIPELKKLYLQNKQTYPFLALEYAAQALQMAISKKDTAEMAVLYNYLGDSYFDKKTFSIALDNYFKSYKIYQKYNDSTNIAYSYINIGAIYFEQNLSSIASGYFEKARLIFEAKKDNKGLSFVLDKIGFVLLKQGMETKALKCFIDSHFYRKSLKDALLTAISNKNIAEVYLQREEYEKAISFLQFASENFKAINNPLNIAETDYKIGDIYMYNKNYNKAVEFYNTSLSNYQKFDKQYEIGLIYNKLSRAYVGLKKQELIKKYAIDALEIANNSDFIDIRAESYSLLSRYYEQKKDIQKAFRFEKMHSNATDSINDAKAVNQSAEMQVSFELQMQENEIQILTKDQELNKVTIRNQQIIGVGVTIFTILLLVLAINLYRSNVSRRKTNQLLVHQKKDIEDKNHELEQQKDAIEESNIKIQRINKNITGSINYASPIQQAMLPKPGSYRKYFKDAFILFKPREIVSGDFYWFSRDEKLERVFIAAVDCTGHGVPGAFMSLIGNTYLNQIVNAHHITDADIILNKLHENIRSSLHQAKNQSRDGMDIALCIIDYKNNVIEFAGARNPLIYIKNNELFQLKGDNTDIGGIQRETERRFTKQTIPLEKGMQLYLFSDGYQDQFGGKDRLKFMRKNFKELLLKIHQFDMMIQMQLLEENFDTWITQPDGSKLEQIDDILVIGFKI
jgi:serine phosphatase RsbU (regulator of sigma subunit)